jgi:pimeloyl-ACP methyl ester carboxylesterase
MGAGGNWRKITPAFEDDYHILTYDQRGHGRSFQPATGYSPTDFATDLAAILRELKWENINLVGHSMGGRNALEFATIFPQRTDKLVVEDIGAGLSRGPMDVIERLLAAVPTPFASRDEAKNFFMHDYESRISFHPQPSVIRQFLYGNLEEKPDGTFDWRFYKPGILEALKTGHSYERWDQIDNLKTPTLWMHGEKSTDLTHAQFEEILRRNPLIRGVEIPDSGHWIHFDQPDAFIRALKDFLTSP